MKTSRLHRNPRRGRDGISDKRAPISKASPAQRDKIAGQPCVHCGFREPFVPVDPAHLAARGFRGGCDDPLCVVALCRTCHQDLDKQPGGRREDFSTSISGKHFKEEIAHMVLHYEGDATAAMERLSGKRVVFLDHDRARELGL